MVLSDERRRNRRRTRLFAYYVAVLQVQLITVCWGFVAQGIPSLNAPSTKSLPLSWKECFTRLWSRVDLETGSSSVQFNIEDLLRDHLQRSDTSPITFTGYVIAKRTLSKKLVFLDLIAGASEDEDTRNNICQALLKRDDYKGANYAWLQKCLHKGSKLQITGRAAPTRIPGNVVLLIQHMKLRTVPRQVQHIETILRQALIACEALQTSQQHHHEMDPLEFVNQVSTACGMASMEDFQRDLLNAATAADSTTSDHRQKPLRDVSKTIFGRLPDDPLYPTDLVDDRALAIAQNNNKRGGSNYCMPPAPSKWQFPPKSLSNGALSKITSLEGTVQNRRRFEGNITVVFLEDYGGSAGELDANEISSEDLAARLECVLHPRFSKESAGSYCGLLGVGSRVSLQGTLVVKNVDGKDRSRPVLWVEDIRLVKASSQPSAMYHLLEMVASGAIEFEEAVAALGLSHQDVVDIITDSTSTDLKWRANRLSVKLQMEQSQKRPQNTLSDDFQATIRKYKHLLHDFPIHLTMAPDDQPSEDIASHENLGDPPATRWETKKLPQVRWMCQKIQEVLRQHPEFGKRRLSILDIGGGKGLLAHYLSRAIRDVEIHVVDISAGAIANGMKKAKRNQYWKDKRPLSMVNFQLADASNSELEHVNADIVVGLHACGHLTDIALAHAVRRRASFVIVPCCFNSNSHLTIPGDTPDSRSSVHEWLNVPEKDWSDLKYVAEVQGDAATASLGMHILCSIRANAVKKKLQQGPTNESPGDVRIISFPVEFSTRNMALIGSVPGYI